LKESVFQDLKFFWTSLLINYSISMFNLHVMVFGFSLSALQPGMCIMECLEVWEYSRIFISNPE